MNNKPIGPIDPAEVLALNRQWDIFQTQKKEAGPGNTSLKDLRTQIEIGGRLLELDIRKWRRDLHNMGEAVRKSHERRRW